MIHSTVIKNNRSDQFERIVWLLVAVEWGAINISGISLSIFHGARLFEFGIDPVYWIFFKTGIPDLITQTSGLGMILSMLTFIGLVYGIVNPQNRINAGFVFFLLCVHYLMITSYMGHRNFQFGFCWTILPFLFKPESRKFTWEALRYWVLIFYATAGLYKLNNFQLISTDYLAHLLDNQWMIYRLEASNDFRLLIIHNLLQNPNIIFYLFWTACMLELFCLIGLITHLFDRYIGWLLILLHVGIWMIWDIAPIGQLSVLIVVFLITPRNKS
jgi:hypothetical protein